MLCAFVRLSFVRVVLCGYCAFHSAAGVAVVVVQCTSKMRVNEEFWIRIYINMFEYIDRDAFLDCCVIGVFPVNVV